MRPIGFCVGMVSFKKDLCLSLIDERSKRMEVEYISKEFKQQLENEMISLGTHLK